MELHYSYYSPYIFKKYIIIEMQNLSKVAI
nr:MAG TPA: hypothetical protein [Bacteriophage sp.]